MKTRSILRSLTWLCAAAFLSMGTGNGCIPDTPDASGFRGEPSLTAEVRDLKTTVISPHLEAAIAPGTTVLWCATFQLVWNEMCSAAGGDLHFVPPENPMVELLNRKEITGADLDSDSYIAVAGACGMDYNKPHHELMAADVSIVDYKSEDGFVIELKTKSSSDHLVLAKITPGATLADTIAAVQKWRAAATPVPAEPSDVLKIPKMHFDLLRHYDELADRYFSSPGSLTITPTKVAEADQSIRFQMDEVGVVLQSEAKMVTIGCDSEGVIMPVHTMIFDKPFLVMLIRDNLTGPYFAMWVDNAELLVKAR